jgi:uncharacterized protein (TIGR03435 family)
MRQAPPGSHRVRRSAVVLAAGLLIFAWALVAQSGTPAASPDKDASAPLPAFEVVSIKPDKSDSLVSRAMFTPDGISISGLPLHMLLREAFQVSDNQLIGEPGWAGGARFDIEAKVAAEDVPRLKALKPSDRWAILLPVFEDRFSLKFHHESRELTQYVLVAAKTGVKMKEAASTETSGPKTPDGKPGSMMRLAPGELIGQNISVQDLLRFLSFQFHSPVIDKTGATGKFDVDLKWAPDETEVGPMRQPDGSQPGGGNSPPPVNAGPSLLTALEEQLGLKLEAHKEPGDAVVIDHIEQPSPN